MMDIYLLDENFMMKYPIDSFDSVIWTERFRTEGDFEIYTPVDDNYIEIAKFIQGNMRKGKDVYLWMKQSNSYMIVESIDLKTDTDDVDYMTIKGRGLETILERRVLFMPIILDGYFVGQMTKLINREFISPSNPKRKIPNFRVEFTDQEAITSLKIRKQATGDTVLDVVKEICEAAALGFEINRDDKGMYLRFFAGEDRSYAQNKNPYIVISSKFENLRSSDYLESNVAVKNYIYVAGEDRDRNRRIVTIDDGGRSGLDLREFYVDARDIQSEMLNDDGETVVLSDEEYNGLLATRGGEKLSEQAYISAFSGEVLQIENMTFGKDYFFGDIVQIVNEYGMEAETRVEEYIRSEDANGFCEYPTFVAVKGSDQNGV